MSGLVKAEFHCHTIYSKDSLTTVADLVATCRRKGVTRLVVTDHNTIAGAQLACQFAPDLVVVGEEIMTEKGELLAFFVQETIPRGLKPVKAIELLRQQGAFISVSHPFDSVRNGAWALADLEEIAPLVDAVETFNSRCSAPQANQSALDFSRKYDLAGTVGSDAHTLWEIGRATLTLAEFMNTAELRNALRDARPELSSSPFFVHIASSYARLYKQIKRKPLPNPE